MRDRGKALECAVYLTLRRQYDEVFYWRDGGEVDFVVLDGGAPVPIQVTWDEARERQSSALAAFYEAYPNAAEAVVVTASTFERWATRR